MLWRLLADIFRCIIFLFCFDAIFAAIQANSTSDMRRDGFGNPAFVALMFIIVLILFPVALMLLLLVRKQILSN